MKRLLYSGSVLWCWVAARARPRSFWSFTSTPGAGSTRSRSPRRAGSARSRGCVVRRWPPALRWPTRNQWPSWSRTIAPGKSTPSPSRVCGGEPLWSRQVPWRCPCVARACQSRCGWGAGRSTGATARSMSDGPRRDAGQRAVRGQHLSRLPGSVLERCNATGSGPVTEDCEPYRCNAWRAAATSAIRRRPPRAAPPKPGRVHGRRVEEEHDLPAGLLGRGVLPRRRQGRLDDLRRRLRRHRPQRPPGQTGFFSTATKGKGNFDYNCDKNEEQEVSQLVNCVRVGSDCQGHGWQQGAIPACGVQGVFITCRPSGPTSCSHDQSQKAQGCR